MERVISRRRWRRTDPRTLFDSGCGGVGGRPPPSPAAFCPGAVSPFPSGEQPSSLAAAFGLLARSASFGSSLQAFGLPRGLFLGDAARGRPARTRGARASPRRPGSCCAAQDDAGLLMRATVSGRVYDGVAPTHGVTGSSRTVTTALLVPRVVRTRRAQGGLRRPWPRLKRPGGGAGRATRTELGQDVEGMSLGVCVTKTTPTPLSEAHGRPDRNSLVASVNKRCARRRRTRLASPTSAGWSGRGWRAEHDDGADQCRARKCRRRRAGGDDAALWNPCA